MRHEDLFSLLRGLTIFLILALGLGFPASAIAQESTTVSVSPSSESIGPGEEFKVNIVVEPKAAMAGVQFDLSFDPALVTVDKVEEGDLLRQSGASTYFNSGKIDNEAGSITGVAGAITEPGKTVSSFGTFAVITLTVKTKEGSCPLNLLKVIVGDKEGKPIPTNVSNGEVTIEEVPASPTPTPTPTPAPAPPPPAAKKPEFRVGPVVKLRPVNDVIDSSNDGLVELFFSNPSLNEVTLQGDMYISVPSGIHVYGEGFGLAGAAGTVYGQFSAPPGTARTIYLNIKADETAAGKTHFIHFEGIYWPDGDKDAYNPMSLTHPFKVIEPSNGPVPPNGEDDGIWMGWWLILAVVVFGGIATIVAVMARRTEVSIEK